MMCIFRALIRLREWFAEGVLGMKFKKGLLIALALVGVLMLGGCDNRTPEEKALDSAAELIGNLFG